ncbi:hypothetical protein MAPG_09911 [Magnaporthiopsis poae ATCC 64411]|uniref:Chromatin assembly factor 1 subunit A n=1 Tax=Magnaporthiopsis poae (strain ATCC 64411 / 73-15) TaxID=644358 RepID=A0A0C4EB65_MAGP6|nr:hypothetical protein MAPG_09911 [Magnaporthiopsis poae ATCC 64411]
MPLLDVSSNVASLDSPSRKRTHEDFVGIKCHDMVQSKLSFAGAAVRSQSQSADAPKPEGKAGIESVTCPPDATAINSPSFKHTPPRPKPAPPASSSIHSPSAAMASATTTAPETPGTAATTLVAAASSGGIPTTTSPANALAPPSTSEPPAKRKRLTPSEKEERAKAEELKKQQKEQEKAAKAAEKAKLEEEKKAKAEEARKRKEEKEEKRREKEEEQRKLQEAKEKKDRSQMRLGAFFGIGGSTPSKPGSLPAKAGTSTNTGSPLKVVNKTESGSGSSAPTTADSDGLTEYRRVFKPFFIKENVKLARNTFELDEPARLAKTKTLDSFVSGEATTEISRFTGAASVDYFCLPALPKPRGRPYPSVRKIMSILSDASAGSSAAPINLDSDPAAPQAQSLATKSARELLREVPMKYLFFFQDVRPAYCGTVSSTPPSSRSLHKLARNPISRDVLPLQYDYDSEAEWVDDGDGEDIDDLDDDEEDHGDEDEDMADFLDDSEDVIKRPVFASGMEPESSGLCFEDGKRLGPSNQMYKFRMEFILDLDHHHSIDPFATHYWEPEVKAAPASTSLHPSTAGSMKPPAPVSSTPANPTNAFAAISQGAAASSAGKKVPLVPPENVEAFKRAILKYPKLSKLGLVEVLSSEFDKCTKAQVKNSVETMAERSGSGQDKLWRLKPEFAF